MVAFPNQQGAKEEVRESVGPLMLVADPQSDEVPELKASQTFN